MDINNPISDAYNESKIIAAPEEIGTPIEDAFYAPGPQERVDSCAIRAQQHVLSMFGIERTETFLVNDAVSHGEYGASDCEGTSLDDVGNILERNGIETNRYVGATMAHLISELGQGHKIIVGVDAYEMVANTPEERFIESQRDLVSETPNHAIVVVNVDPHTLDVEIVDPADGQLHTIPAMQFVDAWRDCNFFMVSTTQSPSEYLRDLGNQPHQENEQLEIIISNNEGEKNMFENNERNHVDLVGNEIADVIESDPDYDGLVECLSIDVNQDGIPDVTIESNVGIERVDPSLGGLGHVSEHEPSLGGLGHVSEHEPSLGSLGHVAGYDAPQDIAVTAYDLDDNGTIDAMGVDINQDGNYDLIGVDLDFDGIPDAIGIDINADGTPDVVGIDINGDSIIDDIVNVDDLSSLF